MIGSRRTRRLLLVGFGGLLLLLAFTGLSAISIVDKIQTRNNSIREDYASRDHILEQLRSDIYLSGTYMRDLLLYPDPGSADLHRSEVKNARSRIRTNCVIYSSILPGEERLPFKQFTAELNKYFDSLNPSLRWNPQQRRKLGYLYMKQSLLPRRAIIVQLAA